MSKNRTPRGLEALLAVLVVLALMSGCATVHPSSASSGAAFSQRMYGPTPPQRVILRVVNPTGGSPSDMPDLSSAEVESLLTRFFSCTSPLEFVRLQPGVDMARLMSRLDDWSAVRLGAMGPLPPEAAEVLALKRASFLVTSTQEYGVALSEVFALFILHSAFDTDLNRMLRRLSQDKQLASTLGSMTVVREQLRRRGMNLSDFPDRPEHLGDVARGIRKGGSDLVSSLPLLQWGGAMTYDAQKRQLPPPYQQALDEVELELMKRSFSPGNAALGVLDELTLGVPLGFYYLAAGTAQGLHSLSKGQYEQATRELMPAALMIALYAGGRSVRSPSDSRATPGTATDGVRLQLLATHIEELQAVAQRLRDQLGNDGIRALARYLQVDPEAARLVIEGGEPGAVALYESQGNVPKAQAWLSQGNFERPRSTRSGGSVGKSPGALSSLVDATVGLTAEVVETKLVEGESISPGPRLSGDVAILEKQRPSLDAPPPEAQGHSLWSEYVPYFEKRLAELKQGQPVKPPLPWEGYQQMRGLVTRGLAYERAIIEVLRADASLPKIQRRFLQGFNDPRIETYVGVTKEGVPGVRYADMLVIERQPLSGSPRVETFSFKSRNLRTMQSEPLTAQLRADATDALRYYGGTLDIRRPGLKIRAQVQRVRLIYDEKLEPGNLDWMKDAVTTVEKEVRGVEVLFK